MNAAKANRAGPDERLEGAVEGLLESVKVTLTRFILSLLMLTDVKKRCSYVVPRDS